MVKHKSDIFTTLVSVTLPYDEVEHSFLKEKHKKLKY